MAGEPHNFFAAPAHYFKKRRRRAFGSGSKGPKTCNSLRLRLPSQAMKIILNYLLVHCIIIDCLKVKFIFRIRFHYLVSSRFWRRNAFLALCLEPHLRWFFALFFSCWILASIVGICAARWSKFIFKWIKPLSTSFTSAVSSVAIL